MAAVDDMLGDLEEFVDLPFPGDQPDFTKQKPPHLKLVEIGDLPEAPENLADEDESNQFDAYGYLEGVIKQVQDGQLSTEEAARTIETGIESITKIIGGIQTATHAMAKAFQAADDAHIAKIVALVLTQQQMNQKTSVVDSSVTLDSLDKKVTPPLKQLLLVIAGTVIGVGLVSLLFKFKH